MTNSTNNSGSKGQASDPKTTGQDNKPAIYGKYVKKDTLVDAKAKQQSLQRVKKTYPGDMKRVNNS